MITSLVGKLALGMFGAMVANFSWFQLVPGFEHGESFGLTTDAHHAFFIPTSWAVVGFVLLLAGLARMGLERAKSQQGAAKYVPDATLTVRNAFEIVIEWLWGMVEGMLHKEAKPFFPLVATLFLYILIANLSGFVPGMLPPTENISHNFAMALCVFVTFVWAGLSRDAVGFLKHLAGPVVLLMPVFFVLESISVLIRPVSLSVRLTVNIFVDHLLSSIARELGAGFVGAIGAIVLPVPLYFLGLLVCVVQAFVFALLTTIYISLSVPHGDGHSAHH
ncbi:MAG: F0F1 ATP synthase subunit A [Myxococcota bacterium]